MAGRHTNWGRRRLNAVSWRENRHGEFFVFGQVGSGKSSVVVGLAYRRTKPGILRAYRKYQGYVGWLMNNVPYV